MDFDSGVGVVSCVVEFGVSFETLFPVFVVGDFAVDIGVKKAVALFCASLDEAIKFCDVTAIERHGFGFFSGICSNVHILATFLKCSFG